MHSKVPSSFMLVVMADGLPNLSSKKLVDSHIHFSAGNWNYRPTNICIEPSLWSAKGWCYWKCILNNSPKLNFGHLGLQLEHFTNKKIGGKRLRPDSAIFFYVDFYGAYARFLHTGRMSHWNTSYPPSICRRPKRTSCFMSNKKRALLPHLLTTPHIITTTLETSLAANKYCIS